MLSDKQQAPNCGYSSLEVDCNNKDNGGQASTMLSVGDYNFQIRDISYQNNSLLLDMQSQYEDDVCRVAKYNISSQLFVDGKKPLRISSTKNKQLFLFFNCSSKPPSYHPHYVSVAADCDFGDLIAYVSEDFKDNPAADTFISQFGCQTVTLPVQPSSTFQNFSSVGEMMTIVDNGFLAEWSYCSQGCGGSKGECPNKNPPENSSCVCPEHEYFSICSPPLGPAAALAPSQAPIHTENGKGKKTQTIAIIAGVVGGFFLITITIISLVIYHCKHKNSKRQASQPSLSQSSLDSNYSMKYDAEVAYSNSNVGTSIFTYQELEEATDGFNSSNELGQGGFGTVYKGNLKDGRVVAIKRLYKNNYKRIEQFRNEVEILSKLKHQNLVCLYGCTSRHSRELLLVYEFVSNGTVADHLHGPRASEGSLTWCLRMNIAIETADALQYLHAVQPQIIHRDVKTNNILLDCCFHVKVADFGLSRLFPLNATHVSTVPQGTPGYVDPEYRQCYQLTEKSDVYSFGVVLVELISSKPAVDVNRPRQEINLSNMAINMMVNNELDQFVDPTLEYNSDNDTKRMIDMVAEVAFKCLQAERDMRPSIKEVLQALRAIQSGETAGQNSTEAEDA